MRSSRLSGLVFAAAALAAFNPMVPDVPVRHRIQKPTPPKPPFAPEGNREDARASRAATRTKKQFKLKGLRP